jgi:hypothetical protein
VTGPDEVTRLLTTPCPAPLGDGLRARLRDRLTSGIGSVAERMSRGDHVLVTSNLLRQARSHPELLTAPEEEFAWKPVFVRRSLGLAVVDACLNGRFASPMEAVGPVSSQSVAEWERTGWRTFHWEPWFAGLAPGARASVLADAVTWATSLWSSFDWRALPRPIELGGAYDQWSCPVPRSVRLKARCELRVPLAGDGTWKVDAHGSQRPMALVSVSTGCPDRARAEELAFVALVAGLRSPSRPLPARVLGLWPDAGECAVVDLDADTLLAAVDRVVSTVDAVVGARAVDLGAAAAGR